MSNADDAASRLSSALDDVFSGRRPTAEWSVDDDEVSGDDGEQTEAYELPEIVPATTHLTPTEQIPVTPLVEPVLPTPPASRTAPAVVPAPAAFAPAGPHADPAPSRPATAWGDHMTVAPAVPAAGNLRTPGRRPRVRRVTRVVRHIDPWSTFKVALLFSAVGYVVVLTSGVLLWRVAESTGTLDNVERWFTQFGWETFELKGGEIFHDAWIIGLFGAVALTGMLVLLATLFNLVSDIVGGIRVTVLEEEVVERTVTSTRRYVVRRPPVGGASAGSAPVMQWDVDGDDLPVADHAVEAPASANSAATGSDWSVDDD